MASGAVQPAPRGLNIFIYIFRVFRYGPVRSYVRSHAALISIFEEFLKGFLHQIWGYELRSGGMRSLHEI